MTQEEVEILENVKYDEAIEEKVKAIMSQKGKKADKLRKLASEITGRDFSDAKIRRTRVHKFPKVYRVYQIIKESDVHGRYQAMIVAFREDGEYGITFSYTPGYYPVVAGL